MPSNEGHIHWTGAPSETVNFLDQELQMTSEATNMLAVKVDPIGAVRIRAMGHPSSGLFLPTDGWQAVPGSSPTLEARMDGHYPIGYIRLRLA